MAFSNLFLFAAKWKIVSTTSIDSTIIGCKNYYGIIPKPKIIKVNKLISGIN